jgi:uncharacterized membrane protein
VPLVAHDNAQRRWQFSLGSLLTGITILSALLAWPVLRDVLLALSQPLLIVLGLMSGLMILQFPLLWLLSRRNQHAQDEQPPQVP